MILRNVIFASLFFCSCAGSIGAGTLSGWDNVIFPTSKEDVQKAIAELYKNNPKYRLNNKWKSQAEYWLKNFSYLETVIFYFSEEPEEMYYVTFVEPGTSDNPKCTGLAIRGVENGVGHWKEYQEYSDIDKIRIDERFRREIVSKIERYTKTKSYKEE